MSTRVGHIRAWAARLAGYHPTGPRVSLLGLMTGVLHSLVKADQLGYRDARGQAPQLKVFVKNFRETLMAVGNGEPPPDSWRAGFYFNSALVRLAPLVERLHVLRETPSRRHLIHDVNWFKHRKKQHPLSPVQTSWDEALEIAGAVYKALEGRLK